MPQETVTIVLSFHDDATRSDRDSDIAYLHQYLAPLVSECSALKSFQILSNPERAGE